MTGEPIEHDAGSAPFARPQAAAPFSVGGALGAWELSARWSVMNLNSNVTPRVPQSITGGVYGGYQQIFGTAPSWYPNDRVRLMLQFQYVNVNKLNPGHNANRPKARDPRRASSSGFLTASAAAAGFDLPAAGAAAKVFVGAHPG